MASPRSPHPARRGLTRGRHALPLQRRPHCARGSLAAQALTLLLLAACGGSTDAAALDPAAVLAELRSTALDSGAVDSSLAPGAWPAGARLEPALSEASPTWAVLARAERKALRAFGAQPTAAGALALGRLYVQGEDPERARAFLLPLLEREPERAAGWTWLGAERVVAGRPGEARVLLGRALELDDGQVMAHVTLAQLELDQLESMPRGAEADPERLAAVRAHLERALELEPGRPDAALELARVHEDGGELEAAAEVLERARRNDPMNPKVLFRLARVRRAEGRVLEADALDERHARAIQIDDLGLTGQGLSGQQIALALGIHYIGEGRAELALAEFDIAASRDADPRALGAGLGGRADALTRLGRLDEAAQALGELRAFDSTHPMLADLEAALAAAAEAPPEGDQ